MTAKRHILVLITLISALLIAMCPHSKIITTDKNQLVRLAVIEVDSLQIEPYNEFLREEIETSIRVEPGVTTLYGVAEKENPERITLFETYGDSSQYRSHLTTSHFQKYKQGTLKMVKHLDLIQMQSILYHRKPELSNARLEELYIRLVKIELDSNAVNKFNKLGEKVMQPGIKKEPGILVMYAIGEKDNPTLVSILEVYKNLDAYNQHITTPHYLKYKKEAKTMIKSLKLIDVNPILLGSKPEGNAK
jgi:quinol monooxygenase YgiN